MKSIVVDAGPLIALFERRDRHHDRATAFVRAARTELVTNVPVLVEVAYLLHRFPEARLKCLRWTASRLRIDKGTPDDLPRIIALLTQYADIGADFADASLIALAERLDTIGVATLDSDFEIFRVGGKKAFRNVLLEP